MSGGPYHRWSRTDRGAGVSGVMRSMPHLAMLRSYVHMDATFSSRIRNSWLLVYGVLFSWHSSANNIDPISRVTINPSVSSHNIDGQ